ncbi:MAG: pitrilysin family protein [Bacteroidota bacterium]|nr:pitrilysin family protein [Bacteroidota bacterium]MDP4212288.1 pitrilysin family protein [Bacteroidota bacterium]MDP4248895.1 pitrilysin family protein [Bacteroidota bacterium]
MLNRKTAPGITDAVKFHLDLPPHEKISLSNGVDVFLVNMGTLDTLMMNIVFYAGNYFEPVNLVASAANFLLKNGTRSKTAYEINEYFEYYGAYLSRHAAHETAELTLHCLNKHVDELLPAVAELISDSVLPEEELAIYKKNMQQRLQVNLRKNDFVASRLIDTYLFGESHPYGRYSSMAEYEALQVEQVRDFYKTFYQQGRCMIFVAGLLPENIQAQLEKYFGGLPLRGSVRPDLPEFSLQPAKQKKYRITNDPDGVQGAIRISRNFPNRHHPDFQKMLVLNNLFGGFFGSRLMANIREDKGYTYGIHSYLTNLIQESDLMISTEAGKEVSEATIKEVYYEMKRLCDDPVPDDELQTSRNFMIGTLLGDLDGPFQVAGRWKSLVLNGLTEDYFYGSVDVIKTVTPRDLQELANKYLKPDDFYELVVI